MFNQLFELQTVFNHQAVSANKTPLTSRNVVLKLHVAQVPA